MPHFDQLSVPVVINLMMIARTYDNDEDHVIVIFSGEATVLLTSDESVFTSTNSKVSPYSYVDVKNLV